MGNKSHYSGLFGLRHRPVGRALLQDPDWAKQIFKTVERSRNIIMHSGYLEAEDIERLGMALRDWLAQIGG